MDTNSCPSGSDSSLTVPELKRAGNATDENALVVEFGLRNIPFQQQPPFDVLYEGQKVGLFIPDLIAFEVIVVDTKVIDRITDHERGLMLNYLRITRLRIGVILNFRPEIRMAADCSVDSCT